MCGKKPKKPKGPPKVVERDMKKEQEMAAAKAAEAANLEEAQARKAKAKMLSMRSQGVQGPAKTMMPGAQAGGKTKLGA